MINQNEVLETIFESVSVPNECADGCEYLTETKNGYGVKGSPTLYDCDGDQSVCPRVKEVLINALGEFQPVDAECIFHTNQAM